MRIIDFMLLILIFVCFSFLTGCSMPEEFDFEKFKENRAGISCHEIKVIMFYEQHQTNLYDYRRLFRENGCFEKQLKGDFL